MLKTIYAVHSDENENNIYDEFEVLEDAINYAKSHIEDKTYVVGTEVEVNDFGEVEDEGASETLWSYDSHEEELPKDNISKSEIFGEDEIETSEISESVEVEEPTEKQEDDWWFIPDEFVAPTKLVSVEVTPVEEPVQVDPLDQNFSLADVSEDEANYQKALEEPVDYLQEIARELGIEDEVQILPSIGDVEDAPEVEQALVSKEPIAVDAPIDPVRTDENGIEPQADVVSHCHACPTCGKEICECKVELSESFNGEEFNRFIEVCKKLGLKTIGEVDKFAKEHGDLKNQDLLKALEDEAAKISESLHEELVDDDEGWDDERFFTEGCCEEDDMTDEEFVEAFGKALKEKHDCENCETLEEGIFGPDGKDLEKYFSKFIVTRYGHSHDEAGNQNPQDEALKIGKDEYSTYKEALEKAKEKLKNDAINVVTISVDSPKDDKLLTLSLPYKVEARSRSQKDTDGIKTLLKNVKTILAGGAASGTEQTTSTVGGNSNPSSSNSGDTKRTRRIQAYIKLANELGSTIKNESLITEATIFNDIAHWFKNLFQSAGGKFRRQNLDELFKSYLVRFVDADTLKSKKPELGNFTFLPGSDPVLNNIEKAQLGYKKLAEKYPIVVVVGIPADKLVKGGALGDQGLNPTGELIYAYVDGNELENREQKLWTQIRDAVDIIDSNKNSDDKFGMGNSEKVQAEKEERAEKFKDGVKDFKDGVKDLGNKIATGAKELGSKVAGAATDVINGVKNGVQGMVDKNKTDKERTNTRLATIHRNALDMVEALTEADKATALGRKLTSKGKEFKNAGEEINVHDYCDHYGLVGIPKDSKDDKLEAIPFSAAGGYNAVSNRYDEAVKGKEYIYVALVGVTYEVLQDEKTVGKEGKFNPKIILKEYDAETKKSKSFLNSYKKRLSVAITNAESNGADVSELGQKKLDDIQATKDAEANANALEMQRKEKEKKDKEAAERAPYEKRITNIENRILGLPVVESLLTEATAKETLTRLFSDIDDKLKHDKTDQSLSAFCTKYSVYAVKKVSFEAGEDKLVYLKKEETDFNKAATIAETSFDKGNGNYQYIAVVGFTYPELYDKKMVGDFAFPKKIIVSRYFISANGAIIETPEHEKEKWVTQFDKARKIAFGNSQNIDGLGKQHATADKAQAEVNKAQKLVDDLRTQYNDLKQKHDAIDDLTGDLKEKAKLATELSKIIKQYRDATANLEKLKK